MLKNSVEYGIQLNSTDDWGDTLLHHLTSPMHAKKGRHAVLEKILLSSKINNLDVNATNNENRTPFHMACFHGHPEVVKVFLDNAKDLKICLNPRDKDGFTPMHLICKNEGENKFQYQLRTIRLIRSYLPQLELDFEAEDKDGHTPSSYARLHGFSNFVHF